MNSQQAQMLMSALGAASSIAGTVAQVEHGKTKLRALDAQLVHNQKALETRLSHEKDIFEIKTGLVRNLIHALIERRVDVVQQGFRDTLTIYAEQARHYMTQQDKYADAEIKAATPLERASIRTRLSEIDLHLTNIRADASALYREMLRVILIIGGTMPPMSSEDQKALAVVKG
jgi:hypothetical protein